MDTKERRKMVRKQLKELGLNKRRKFVRITCISCGKEDEIHTNDPSLYTDKVRKTYQCWKCKK
jgi:ribosomal protein S27E